MFKLNLRKIPPLLQHGLGPLTVTQQSQTMVKWKFPKERNKSDVRRARHLQQNSYATKYFYFYLL